MKTLLSPTYVMKRDSQRANAGYTMLAVLVALSLFIAASGSGSAEQVQPSPEWLDIGGNILSVVFGVLVLLPRTRIIGALYAVFVMFLSMYLNYTFDGVEFFVMAIPYNTLTIAFSSILVGHYMEDLFSLFEPIVAESSSGSPTQLTLD
ncbi:MAG: hypothetical protein AAF846_22820 [Chloroflexota bacterium]